MWLRFLTFMFGAAFIDRVPLARATGESASVQPPIFYLDGSYQRNEQQEPRRRIWMSPERLAQLQEASEGRTRSVQTELYRMIFNHADVLASEAVDIELKRAAIASNDKYAGQRGASICLKVVGSVGLKYLSLLAARPGQPKVFSDPEAGQRRKYFTRAAAELEWALGPALNDAKKKSANLKSGDNLLLWVPRVAACLGISYDWFYPDLSIEERARISDGIENYLQIVMTHHQSIFQSSKDSRRYSNWNAVVNSYSGIAARAVLKSGIHHDCSLESSYVVRNTLCSTFQSLPDFINRSITDSGAYFESPTYLDLAFQGLVAFGDVLHEAFGADQSFLHHPKLVKVMKFESLMISPSSGSFGRPNHEYWPYVNGTRVYNFGDSESNPVVSVPTAAMMRTADPTTPGVRYVAAKVAGTYLNPTEIQTWQQNPMSEPLRFLTPVFYEENFPMDFEDAYKFETEDHVADFAVLNSAWEQPHASYAAIKAGLGNANHAHLDSGSVIFDAYGVRWFGDLGKDDYKLPQYFTEPKRWNYFRTNNLGHSTIQIGTHIMVPDKRSVLVSTNFTKFKRQAVVDLTEPYSRVADSVKRSLLWQDRSGAISLVSTDKVKLKSRLPTGEVVASQFIHCWRGRTACPIDLKNNAVTIRHRQSYGTTESQREVKAVFTSNDANVKFRIVSADPYGQNSAPLCRNLEVVSLNPRTLASILVGGPKPSDRIHEGRNANCAIIRAELGGDSFFTGSTALTKTIGVTISVAPNSVMPSK